MVLDTNIVIYAARPDGGTFRPLLKEPAATISVVTRIEAFGYPRISAAEEKRIEDLLASLTEADLDDRIVRRAIELRQQRRMDIADAVIAATALELGVALVARNVADFRHIGDLNLINPFDWQ